MITKAYALSVLLAVVAALLLSAVPLGKRILEYRSPELVDTRPELASVDAFIVAKRRFAFVGHASGEGIADQLDLESHERWETIYNAEKQQHIEAMRQRAGRNCIAYGTLWGLCIILLLVHVPLAHRR